MPDMSAALGLSQLARLDAMQARRHAIADAFIRGLRDVAGVTPAGASMGPNDRHAWCMFPVLIDPEETGIDRDSFVASLAERNIGASVHYIPTHLFTAYRGIKHAPLPVTERVWSRIASLPLYPSMTDEDVDDVLAAVREVALGKVQAGR